MAVTELQVHYNIITICFPALIFGCIVLYIFFRGRFKRSR
jgi:hypothetical protein